MLGGRNIKAAVEWVRKIHLKYDGRRNSINHILIQKHNKNFLWYTISKYWK